MKHILLSALALTVVSAQAHTVLLDQNFDSDYSTDFPVVLELDHLPPAPNVNPIFTGPNGVAMPWWPIKDAITSSNRFLASHSIYQKPGKSNDWIGSRGLTIPSEGFKLTFDAQSMIFREGGKLSDLWVYITEEPLSSDNLPTEPTLYLQDVSEGNNRFGLEDDFTSYEIDLDPWVGKTIYVNFANLNEDRDFMVIDNVLVQRLDMAELLLETPGQYVLNGSYDVTATINGTDGDGLGKWVLTFDDGKGNTQQVSGEKLAMGESFTHTFSAVVDPDSTSDFTVTLSGEGNPDIIETGSVTGLAFMPDHRVLFEEATGTWCGNCPLGSYTIESMMLDPEMKDRVIPVSIHIPGNGSDYMVNETYAGLFGVTSAPMSRTERDTRPAGFSNYDANYNLNEPNSIAYSLRERSMRPTLADISLEAAFVEQHGDSVGIICDVIVRPAITLKGNYRIGLIMTENNVMLRNNKYWAQTNYAAGDTSYESNLGGWTLLPKMVLNARYQDVARGVWGYRGLDNSLPAEMEADKDQYFTYEIEIPDTYLELTPGDPSTVVSPSINPANIVMVAYIIDEDNLVLNAASFPMTEQAEERFTIADLVKENGSGVNDLPAADSNVPAEYYSLQGFRLSAPVKGEPVIVRRGSTVTKQIFE